MKERILLPIVAVVDLALLGVSITLLMLVVTAGSTLFLSVPVEPAFIPRLLNAATASVSSGIGVYCTYATYHHLMERRYMTSAIYSVLPVFFWAAFELVLRLT